MSQYVYHLSVRKPNNEKKKFLIESDLIYTKEKITQEQANQIAIDNECDVMISYIGELKPSKKETELIKAEYYDTKKIGNIIQKWEKESSENGNQDLQPIQ